MLCPKRLVCQNSGDGKCLDGCSRCSTQLSHSRVLVEPLEEHLDRKIQLCLIQTAVEPTSNPLVRNELRTDAILLFLSVYLFLPSLNEKMVDAEIVYGVWKGFVLFVCKFWSRKLRDGLTLRIDSKSGIYSSASPSVKISRICFVTAGPHIIGMHTFQISPNTHRFCEGTKARHAVKHLLSPVLPVPVNRSRFSLLVWLVTSNAKHSGNIWTRRSSSLVSQKKMSRRVSLPVDNCNSLRISCVSAWLPLRSSDLDIALPFFGRPDGLVTITRPASLLCVTRIQLTSPLLHNILQNTMSDEDTVPLPVIVPFFKVCNHFIGGACLVRQLLLQQVVNLCSSNSVAGSIRQ